MRPQGYHSGIADQFYRNYHDDQPKTLEECNDIHTKLTTQKRAIETELANKNITLDGKTRMKDHDYQILRSELIYRKNKIETLISENKVIRTKLIQQKEKRKTDNIDIINELNEIEEKIKLLKSKFY